MIELLNREFNAVELNLTDVGFPAWLEGLAVFKAVQAANPEARKAFPTPAVVDAEGTFLLAGGDSGSVVPRAEQASMIYDTPRYLEFLHAALDRNNRLEALRNDQKLAADDRARGIASLRLEVSQDLDRMLRDEKKLQRARR